MSVEFEQESVGTIVNWVGSQYFIRDDDAAIYLRSHKLEEFLEKIWVEGKEVKVKVIIKVTEI
jgi:hypothetical protein